MRFAYVLLVLLCSVGYLPAPIVTLTFMGGNVLEAVPLYELSGDSIRVGDQWVHLNRVMTITRTDQADSSWGFWTGLGYGSQFGALTGCIIGSRFKRTPKGWFTPSSYISEGCAAGCVAGAAVGGALGASRANVTKVSFVGLTLAQRRYYVQKILETPPNEK